MHFDNIESYDLSEPYTVPLDRMHDGPGYMLSAFHQLHCLVSCSTVTSHTSLPRESDLTFHPVIPGPTLPARLRRPEPHSKSRSPLRALLRLHSPGPDVRWRYDAGRQDGRRSRLGPCARLRRLRRPAGLGERTLCRKVAERAHAWRFHIVMNATLYKHTING